MDVFVSVGTGLNPRQEEFVSAVEDRLRSIGLSPRTIGRNTFSSDAPLHAISDLMEQCDGAVVIALERYYFRGGEERRGAPSQIDLTNVSLPTVWNQIEAAMAYSSQLPLLVIVDQSLRAEGLLEKGNNWFVQDVPVEPASLNTPAFNGILASWRSRLGTVEKNGSSRKRSPDPATQTLSQLAGALKPGQLWATLVALAGALAAAFALGARTFG